MRCCSPPSGGRVIKIFFRISRYQLRQPGFGYYTPGVLVSNDWGRGDARTCSPSHQDGIGSPSSFSRVGTRNPALSGGSRHALYEAYFYASCGTMRGAGSRSRMQVQDRVDTRQDDTDVLWTGFACISKPTTKRDRYVPLKT